MKRFIMGLLVVMASLCLFAIACDDDDDNDAAGDADADGDGDGDADGDPPEPGCRNYGTDADVSSAAINGTSTAVFDQAALALTSTFSFTMAHDGSSGVQTTVDSYSSLADFVDESRTVGLQRLAKKVETGELADATTTYSYDEDGQLVSMSQESTQYSILRTYTEWDTAGRPTAGSFAMAGNECTDAPITIVYDDAARKRTETVKWSAASGPACGQNADRIESKTYDVNGNIVEMFMGEGDPATDSIAMTVNDTTEICLP